MDKMIIWYFLFGHVNVKTFHLFDFLNLSLIHFLCIFYVTHDVWLAGHNRLIGNDRDRDPRPCFMIAPVRNLQVYVYSPERKK